MAGMNISATLALVLAATGCMATEGNRPMAQTDALCSINGEAKVDLSPDALCAAVTRGFVAGGGDAASRIVLEVISPTRLDAVVTDADGQPHGPVTFDVMDTQLRADMLEGFGADLANVLKRAKAADD